MFFIASLRTLAEIDTLRNDFNAFTQKYLNDSQQGLYIMLYEYTNACIH